MTVRRYPKKTKKMNLPLVLAGLLLIGVAFVFSLVTLANSGNDQNTNDANAMSRQEFIEALAPHAKELQAGYGVLPSIIIGQACLESNFGQSTLASTYNNLFGVKAYGGQEKVNLETQEYLEGHWVTIQGDFRVYPSWEESMNDHTQLFLNGVDWDPHKYEPVLQAKDYHEAAQALQKAGYATDPTYADKIVAMIEQYQLHRFD